MHLVWVHLQLLDLLRTGWAGPQAWLNRRVAQDTVTRHVVHAWATENMSRCTFHAGTSANIVAEAPLHTLDTANCNLAALCSVIAGQPRHSDPAIGWDRHSVVHPSTSLSKVGAQASQR